ncbi:hypothetical protein LOZ61_003860 [Ophidiomyces ophidiicola]|uniref:Uncharacterized protein n=1 Tax=Ophidiomyces ophidiicola TaxID=1387563 RepID=A0ACB8UXU1_9EURO|nr:hypothetical protein LOZ61_003860 [Ophidiomyces ophidiicola]KAI1918515.1 hypothetical protein LOZ64_002745 [Ophidiomyces ophidiicola]KAI1926875.1 hypothetical protein LOZ60_003365 [Ophidiomyces ophidiicola]KAI1958792.1 hypothetical protein LOZ59_003355 [Ophidiomyces ophidiicola]KAI1972142.1 hypothetical protein LOZ56_002668 [Ophidiomyces ophidiicola]
MPQHYAPAVSKANHPPPENVALHTTDLSISTANATASRFLGGSQKSWLQSSPTAVSNHSFLRAVHPVKKQPAQISRNESAKQINTGLAHLPSPQSPPNEDLSLQNSILESVPQPTPPSVAHQMPQQPPPSIPSRSPSINTSHSPEYSNIPTPHDMLTAPSPVSNVEPENGEHINGRPISGGTSTLAAKNNAEPVDTVPFLNSLPQETAINGHSDTSENIPIAHQAATCTPVLRPEYHAPATHRHKRLRTSEMSNLHITPACQGTSYSELPATLHVNRSLCHSKSSPSFPVRVNPCFHGMNEILQDLYCNLEFIRLHATPTERSRVDMLQSVCYYNDFFFLALHQAFCVYATKPELLQIVPGFGVNQITGLLMFKDALFPPGRYSESFLTLCSDFPASFSELVRNNQIYTQALGAVMYCLPLMSQRWAPFLSVILQRRYPPLIDELVSKFGLPSSRIRLALFLRCCELLSPDRNSEWLSRINTIHSQDQAIYEARLAKAQRGELVSPQTAHQENVHIASDYTHAISLLDKSAKPGAGNTNGTMAATTNIPPPPPAAAFPTSTASFANMPNASPLTASFPQSPGAAQFFHAPHPQPRAMPAPITRIQQATQPPGNSMMHQINSPQFHNIPQQSHGTFSLQPQTQIPAQNRNPNAPQFQPPIRGYFRQSPRILAPQTQPRAFGNHVYTTPHSTPTSPQHPPHFQLSGYQHTLPLPPSTLPSNIPVSNAINIPVPRQAQHQIQTPLQSSFTHQSPQIAPITTLLPRPGARVPESAYPNPYLIGLHQMDLRVGTRELIDPKDDDDDSKHLLIYFQTFAIRPFCIGIVHSNFSYELHLTQNDFKKLPAKIPTSQYGYPILGYISGTHTYQLRCVRLDSPTQQLADQEWATADCCWPVAIYIHINDVEHFARRKFHHGKDLPLDITGSLKQGGNKIKITILRTEDECNKLFYSIGVEILQSISRGSARNSVEILSKSASINQIMQRLNAPVVDDEISIVDDYIAINLIDPFTARIFETPVRGRFCSHLECFDLDTFLNTRMMKVSKGQNMAGHWKCPICSRDARPKSLLIDEFLLDVRSQLALNNRLDDAKAITVRKDGLWTPKYEQINATTNGLGTSSRCEEDTVRKVEAPSRSTPSLLTRKPTPQVIEID